MEVKDQQENHFVHQTGGKERKRKGMDDIEDLVSERASSPQRLERERNVVFPKRRAVGARPAEAAVDSHAAEAGHVAAAATCSKDSTDSSKSRGGSSSFVPGNATIYTKTWGCGHNTSDGRKLSQVWITLSLL